MYVLAILMYVCVIVVAKQINAWAKRHTFMLEIDHEFDDYFGPYNTW